MKNIDECSIVEMQELGHTLKIIFKFDKKYLKYIIIRIYLQKF